MAQILFPNADALKDHLLNNVPGLRDKVIHTPFRPNHQTDGTTFDHVRTAEMAVRGEYANTTDKKPFDFDLIQDTHTGAIRLQAAIQKAATGRRFR